MKFYQLTRADVLFRLPSAQGWALIAWSIENNGVTEMELASDGYLAQHSPSLHHS